VLTGYMIALAVIMPASGYLSDTYGIKRLYLISMVLFTLGSLLCGLAWNVSSLVFFRVLQGLGGGMLGPLGMTLIFRIVPVEKRPLMASILGVPMTLAPIMGPTVGGYLVQYVSWRVIFTLNIPVGALGLLLGALLLRETERIPNLHLDWRGFILSGGGFASLLYGLQKGPALGWSDPQTLGFLVGGVLSLILWVRVELSDPQPLLELRVLKNPTYALGMGIIFVMTVGLFSSMLLLPLFLQNLRGLGAMQTGVLLIPQALASGLIMPFAGQIYNRVGPRPMVLTGLTVLVLASWRMSFLDVTTPDATLRLLLVFRGMAMGMCMMPVFTAAMNTLTGPLVARGSSLTNVLNQVFGAFGTALFVTLLQARQTYHQAMLSQVLTPDLPAVRITLAAVQRAVLQRGATLAQANAAGGLVLYQQMASRAAVRAYDDCFLIAAAACLLAIVPAIFLHDATIGKRPPQRMPPPE
jgi:EmrB/QacA subfamily drug resistance transporter